MTPWPTHPPLKVFLKALSDEQNPTDRRAVAVGLESFVGSAALQFDLSQAQVLGHQTNYARDQAAVATVFHLFWKLVPARLFEPVEPNYRRLVDIVLEQYKQIQLDSDTRRNLTLVFKRLRQQHFERREATSLDLTRVDHGLLLERQGNRCAMCGYEFTQSDVDLYYEDEYVLRRPHVPVSERELVLHSIMRSPVLDHILPLFIGGDCSANWQILCRTCNAGKGETWSTLVRASVPPRRVDEVLFLTPMLRYLVLAEYVRRNGAPRTELHITKKRAGGLVVLHNLEAVTASAFRSV